MTVSFATAVILISMACLGTLCTAVLATFVVDELVVRRWRRKHAIEEARTQARTLADLNGALTTPRKTTSKRGEETTTILTSELL